MGGCFSVSLSCDQAVNQVSHWLCLKGSYIHNLPENLASLQEAMRALKARRDDVQGKVNREEFTGNRRRLSQVQSALFALAISDIVLINMWCHDFGREQADNKPLLKTLFQVMMRLFSPRKTTMLFVIRDKARTPLENLEPVLREDIQKIWDSVPKPEAHKETPLSDFFNVEVVALSSYEEKEEQFKEQVCVCERPGLLQMLDTYVVYFKLDLFHDHDVFRFTLFSYSVSMFVVNLFPRLKQKLF